MIPATTMMLLRIEKMESLISVPPLEQPEDALTSSGTFGVSQMLEGPLELLAALTGVNEVKSNRLGKIAKDATNSFNACFIIFSCYHGLGKKSRIRARKV